jgi:tRNA pseudouridine-54 N-methylase
MRVIITVAGWPDDPRTLRVACERGRMSDDERSLSTPCAAAP